MEYGAIDLHTRRSEIRIVAADGSVLLERRIDTRPWAFTQVFERPPMRVLVESSTESEWVAQGLEALGHEVIVADPNYAPMYGQRTRRVKTDRRDVAALADACRLGLYRPAHRVSHAMQTRRQHLRVREHALRMRTQTINTIRAMLRQAGLRVPSGTAATFEARLGRVPLDAERQAVLAPLVEVLGHLTAVIGRANAWVRTTAAADPVAQRLMTVPGVGPVVALSFQATLDTPARFGGDAARVSAYLGLVPSERSSGERQRKGAITKTGPRSMRALLTQAAWVLWRRARQPGSAALRAWTTQLAARRGKFVAVVALARRLSRILYAVWRDDRAFQISAPAAT